MNVLEFALNMELDGENYYKEQAEINKNNGLVTVFMLLAKDEENHARIIQNKIKDEQYKLEDSKTLSKSKSVFKEVANFKSEVMQFPKQLDLYRTALDMEKKSIDLYKKNLAESTDDKMKKLFEYLVKQEEDHFAIIEELVKLTNNPEEWVESAEFGTRKEY